MNLTMIAQIFEVCIIPLLAVLTKYIINYIIVKQKQIGTEIDKIQNEENAKLLQKYIDQATNTVIKCVKATNQTYVDSLKQQGKFDDEAQKIAFTMTYQAVIDILSEDALLCLNEAFGDINQYLNNLIESTVSDNKK